MDPPLHFSVVRLRVGGERNCEKNSPRCPPNQRDRLPHVEQLHGFPPRIRAQVRITHRHLDRAVPQELLDRFDGHLGRRDQADPDDTQALSRHRA